MKSKYLIWILTAFVILGALMIIWSRRTEVHELKLNEIADFIGVFVSALAFIWLIYGYHMQAIELKLQREELRNQVENSGMLVNEAKLQTQADMELIHIEQNKIKEDFNRSIRPILVFYSTGKDENSKTSWVVKNVGISTAINVIVSCAAMDKVWFDPDTILFPALVGNEFKVLNWITKKGALLAIYSDIENNEYTTICMDNKNKIEKGNAYPELMPQRYEYQLDQKQMK